MKKEYQAPTLAVYELSAQRCFLAGSFQTSTRTDRIVDDGGDLD